MTVRISIFNKMAAARSPCRCFKTRVLHFKGLSALKKLTEEPLPTKKVRRRTKVLAEKERASI